MRLLRKMEPKRGLLNNNPRWFLYFSLSYPEIIDGGFLTNNWCENI